jgi:hypothetical protein
MENMLNLFKKKDLNIDETLKEIINIIVPKEHSFEIEYFEKVLKAPEEVINLKKTRNLYGVRSETDEDFKLFVLFDVLRDGYLTKYDDSFNNENLWGTLSAMLSTYGYDKYRQELSNEIYDNKSKDYTIKNCNTILNDSPFVFYEIFKKEFKAVSIVKKTNYMKIKELFNRLNVKVVELN